MSREPPQSDETALRMPDRKQEQYEALLSRGMEPDLAKKLIGFEGRAKMSTPSLSLTLWTHDELVQRAQVSGIRNAKTLSRDELIELLGSEMQSEKEVDPSKEI